MHHVRIKTSMAAVVSLMIAAAVWVMVSPDSPSFAVGDCRVLECHVIEISPRPASHEWAASADLFDGKGNKIYHWSESHGAGKDHVRWEFVNGRDGGWINLTINAIPGVVFGERLPLDQNYCYEVREPDAKNPRGVDPVSYCPFS